ncbi:MAG: phenylalanine--tRNA ligase subunit beta [Parcubacteria group bacterium]|nr:phenylalanine--tRNA ligase subunit beta [Parcubacteria group bacterium]
MLVSYNKLQTYFSEPLLKPVDLKDVLTRRAFEVEEIYEKNSDTLIDIDVLPNRAHDCLSHRGIAKEIAVLTGLAYAEPETISVSEDITATIDVDVREPRLCRRYMGRVVEGVAVVSTPEEGKVFLENRGDRSINNIVDATNVTLFDIGQPLHAFDADKVEGGIVVRHAEKGERMTTLDGKELELSEKDVVIADQGGVLALAGVKGGRKAEVNEGTTRIILESANFDPVSVRKSANRHGIKTDASKRFENELSAETARVGMNEVSALIKEWIPKSVFGPMTDVYPNPEEDVKVEMSLEKINSILGSTIATETVEEIFGKLHFAYKKEGGVYTVTPPKERLDIRIAEDVAEEVGRVYGYEHIVGVPLPTLPESVVEKEFFFINRIRQELSRAGYTEIMTSSFRAKGEMEVTYPAASDKGFLRSTLMDMMQDRLVFNARNTTLFGKDDVRLFEIGHVFDRERGERLMCVLGVVYPNMKPGKATEKAKSDVKDIVAAIAYNCGGDEEMMDAKYISLTSGVVSQDGANLFGGHIVELDLGAFIDKLETPAGYGNVLDTPNDIPVYTDFSVYPFMTRDVAFWTPGDVSEEEARKEVTGEGDELLVRTDLFDVFEKEGRTSYAFRMVFQAMDRTLTDEEVNKIMNDVYAHIEARGWEVR